MHQKVTADQLSASNWFIGLDFFMKGSCPKETDMEEVKNNRKLHKAHVYKTEA